MEMKLWPDRPKGLSERSYRKYMAKQKKITIEETDYTLQSVSPKWYYDLNDRCGMTGGKKNTAGYIDELLKNVVVEPAEVRTQGLNYFNEIDDGIFISEMLVKQVESFLRGGR